LCLATHRRVQSVRSGICAVGENPRFCTAQAPSVVEQCPHYGFANAAALMIRGHADFIDPQLCRLVRMDIVHTGRESDDLPLLNRHRQMVAMVAEEFAYQPRIERVVKDAWCDVGKDRLIMGIEDSGLQRHVTAF
jgi:hypothetical protein